MNRHVGKAVRDAMRPDPPGAVAERIANRAACERAHREMMERFGAITAENAREAIDWQEARISEIKANARAKESGNG
jgi:hypothetical protein